MNRDEALSKYKDLLAADSTVTAYLLDGELYYRYEWLNEVEMAAEIVYYKLNGNEEEEEGSKGEIVPLGKFYKAEKNGDQLK